ncbi:hypothetical protein [Mangrovimicrobium sediminis]|uniref:hypothetical protein n=1 Tax=Mangrovimicrobium sediminis TaxID=2562682 RepID=UPI001436B29C|nr:hypothetical protein [Haliea sp. SAOS-164]
MSVKRAFFLVLIFGLDVTYAMAESSKYVTGFYANILIGYSLSDPDKEVFRRKNPEKNMDSDEKTLPSGEKVSAYLHVIGEDKKEGLWMVEFGDERFWVEKVAVDVRPSKRYGDDSDWSCDSHRATSGKNDVSQISGTVGLGESCKSD